MESVYPVFYEGKRIGNGCVVRNGLYHKISCRCTLPEGEPFRLLMSSSQRKLDLGICVPFGTVFGIDTNVPAKLTGEAPFEFTAVMHTKREHATFVPVRCDEPFCFITALKGSILWKEGNVTGVLIPDYNEISKPTGQWSEPKMEA